MKVSLVTWWGDGNYGTNLQSFALYKKIEELGYDVQFVLKIGVVNSIKAFFTFICGQNKAVTKPNAKEQKIQSFKATYQLRTVYNILPKFKLRHETSVFVAGSDQIWNTQFYWDPFYFLSFAGHNKRISYASSIGTNAVNPKFQAKVKNYLLKFQHISVREQIGVNVLSALTGRTDIVHVLDPTFLLTAAEWKTMCQTAEIEIPIPDKFILSYFVGNRKGYNRQLQDIRQQCNIQNIINIPSFESNKGDFEHVINYCNAGPREFIKLLSAATVVCTDSFHAMALSINLQKDFIAFKRFDDTDLQSQNSRVDELLEHYNLSNQFYSPNNQAGQSHICFDSVQVVLAKDREQSLNYLTNALKN